jgi:hexosaminidase
MSRLMRPRAFLEAAALGLIFAAPAQSQSPGEPLSIVPQPMAIKRLSARFSLNRQTVIAATDEEARRIAELFNEHLLQTYGFKLPIKPGQPRASSVIIFTRDSSRALPAESYRLMVQARAIKLTGQGAGLFYGAQSLIQLLPAREKLPLTIPGVEITDQPRFRYRGMHLDVGRHFFPVPFIRKYLDLMAQYKLNYFHWHLTEDQGWRIEIKQYPKLTEVGAWRKETVKERQLNPYVGDSTPHGGYYTQEEVKAVVAYARERFITIVPEIEMPGHSQAALAAYPELSCTGGPFEVSTTWGVHREVYCPKEETFTFLQNVLTEVMALFPGPYVHIGGDECPKDRWKQCAHCQALIQREGLKDEDGLQSYFIRRIERFLNANGKQLIGWDEILEGGLAPRATVMSWRGERGGIEAARQRHDVVMTPTGYCYFDYGQGDPQREPLHIGGYLPLKKVYGYDPVPAELQPAERKHILGAQGNVWTEYLKTPAQVEYMAFPRLLALAEVVWSPAESKDYDGFLRRLPAQLARLEKQQVSFRIPEPDGLQDHLTTAERVSVRLSSYLPGSRIHYTLDGSEPDERSPVYRRPFGVALLPEQKITLQARVVTPRGRRSVVYRTALQRRSPKEAVSYTGNRPGLVFTLAEGRFASVRELGQAAARTSGETRSFDLGQFQRQTNYGVTFEGYLRVPVGGVYQFSLEADDGAALIIDDEVVVSSDSPRVGPALEGRVALKPGVHRIKLSYFQRGGEAALRLWWARQGRKLEPLPERLLFH